MFQCYKSVCGSLKHSDPALCFVGVIYSHASRRCLHFSKAQGARFLRKSLPTKVFLLNSAVAARVHHFQIRGCSGGWQGTPAAAQAGLELEIRLPESPVAQMHHLAPNPVC